jgi:hypothetical protein
VVFRSPECRSPGETLALEAQSVPTAEFVPCIAALPLGWSFRAASIRSGSSRIYLDSDRADGKRFSVELSSSCDVTGATQVPTDEPGTERYERVRLDDERYAGTRYYRFGGGCVTYHFDFEGTGRTALAEEASLAMSLYRRADGAALLREIGLEL